MPKRLPLRLLGRPDCEICEGLYGALITDAAIAALGIEVVNIDEHPDLQARYHFRIPVLVRGETELWAGPVHLDTLENLIASVLSD